MESAPANQSARNLAGRQKSPDAGLQNSRCSLIGRRAERVKERPRIGDDLLPQQIGFDPANLGDARGRERHPRRFVAFSAMGNRGEIRRVGLNEDAVTRNCSDDIVACPILERDNATKRHVPAGIQGGSGEADAAGETVKHPDNPVVTSLLKDCGCVAIRVARVDYNGERMFLPEFKLQYKRAALLIARCIVVMVVQPTLANGDRAFSDQQLERGNVGARVERCGIVWVNAGSETNEARMRCRDPS